jgi:hypothetical protein
MKETVKARGTSNNDKSLIKYKLVLVNMKQFHNNDQYYTIL